MIRPFLDFIPPRDDVSRCDVAITPACLRALYDFTAPSTFIPVSPENRLGIFEEGDYYAQQDLNLFYANFTPYIPQGYGPKVDGIDGGQAPTTVLQDAGGESDLDLELAIPIICKFIQPLDYNRVPADGLARPTRSHCVPDG